MMIKQVTFFGIFFAMLAIPLIEANDGVSRQFFGVSIGGGTKKINPKAIIGYYGIGNLYGAITGNKGLQDTGAAIGALGLGTKLGAHILPSGRNTSDSETNEEIEYVKSSEEHLKARAAYFGDRSNINFVVGYNETTGQCAVCMVGSSLLLLQNINEVGSDGEEYINRPLFSDLMTILDESWSDVTADIELAARLCCGHDDCYFSAWDLKTMEIWNLKDNVLALAPGAEDF